MTTGNTGASGVTPPASGETEQNEVVSPETHKRLLAQRKADQERARRAEEELTTLRAEKEAATAAQLAEQKRFEELYTSEKAKREAAEQRATELTQKQIDAAKQSALVRELGGVKKDEFLRFADVASIRVNEDGSVDPDSLREVATKFRQSYPELLNGKPAAGMGNVAAADPTPPKDKPLHEMTTQELRAMWEKDHAHRKAQ